MTLHLPLLKGHDVPGLPTRGGGCLVCGKDFASGVVYFSAGAVKAMDSETADDESKSLEAFLDIGFHSAAIDVSGSANLCIVDDLEGGQVDFSFCSTQCLRDFLLSLVAELEIKLPPHKRN